MWQDSDDSDFEFKAGDDSGSEGYVPAAPKNGRGKKPTKYTFSDDSD